MRRVGLVIRIVQGVAALALCALTLAFYLEIRSAQSRAVDDTLAIAAAAMTAEAEADLAAKILALERMAARWIIRPDGTPYREWEQDARAYVADLDGLMSLAWAAPDETIRWVVPQTGNEGMIGQRMSGDPEQQRALNRARMTFKPAISPPVSRSRRRCSVSLLAIAMIRSREIMPGPPRASP